MIDLAQPGWERALTRGLGARVVAAGTERPIAVAIFPAGPFRIAYPDFPVGRTRYGPAELAALLERCEAEGADVVRLHVHEVPDSPRASAVQPMGTVRIADLAGWTDGATDKARRSRNRAARTELRITGSTAADGDRLHALYLGTVERHSGRVRYSPAYFREIAALGCSVAWQEDRLVGFVCSGVLDGDAYYLHGGQDPEARSSYSSDLLFRHMLLEARDRGARTFDFLPSPSSQPSLQQYKVAWGGEPGQAFAVDFAIRPLRAMAFRVARAAADRLPAAMVRRMMRSGEKES